MNKSSKGGNVFTVKGLTIPYVGESMDQPQLLFINVNYVHIAVSNCTAQIQLDKVEGLDTYIEGSDV